MSQKPVLRPLVLGSTSRYRAALLERLGVPFTATSSEVDETEVPGEAPAARARRLAEAKAEAVAVRHPEAVVIGGDQVAAARDLILHKPGNAEACREQLRFLSGTRADFHTAVTVRCLASGLKLTHVDTTAVTLRALDDAEIGRYVERERPFDCAGGFKAEALGITLFERMDSQDPTAIVGLPLIWLAGALRGAGYELP